MKDSRMKNEEQRRARTEGVFMKGRGNDCLCRILGGVEARL